ncbi:MAG: hypothetical protein GWO16_04600, partial [Gammaproteobacteria bacterium]|nr:hypothetical protein [Gammaproteobacteria bacterium]NIR97375.1 hypothetical protein [Gammaproteobacteria bacterium]NIT63032.1 hypothetical protein [Gammaproteobacteria bacterium]NIV19984.1 hypothetical protein [Gammaproteobacteria bacterium]NIY31612.1 hypothetical protein [Gammaproteobacteria bacterium]
TRHTEDDGLTVAEVLADGRLRVHKQIVTTSLLGGSSAEDIVFTLEERPPGGVTALALLNDGSMLYAGTATGHILR